MKAAAILCVTAAAFWAGCSDDDSGSNNNNDNTNAVCGNGVVEPGEQCDEGASNSDVDPDACRTDCRSAYCGDGVIDRSEGCDGDQLGGETCATVDATYTGGNLQCGNGCTFDTSNCAVCGNDQREPTEECDGADVGTATCSDLTGLQQGIVACTATCGYDTSDCHSCGNDLIEGDETCEGEDLGGLTCELLGYAYGTLRCGSDCQFDEGQCHSVCGNGIREPGEACDGADFGGADCAGMGLMSGQLRCTVWCDISLEDCTSCGDGVRDPAEECDGSDFGGEDCASLGSTGSGGALDCSGACRIETTGCTADASCGDGIINQGEQCDGNALGGQDCVSAYPALYGGGNLACSSACLHDTAACTPAVACGNGQAEPSLGEQCDGPDLDGQTCQGLGFPGGVLACGQSCGYDTSGCDAPLTCGDGTRDAGEACDQQDLGSATCLTIGFVGGTLACRTDCSYDTGACLTCGDGVVSGTDQCDGANLGGETCGTLGYYGGTLACDSGCAFDRASCEAAGWCGDGVRQASDGEQCDGQEFGSDSCTARGFDGGVLSCTGGCQVTTGGCATCGNGICEIGEPGTCPADCLVKPLAAGEAHTCAVNPDSTVHCWGSHSYGQLGDGTATTSDGPIKTTPVQVVGPGGTGVLSGVTEVVAGNRFNCALKEDGTVFCWGQNGNGQLGFGVITNSERFPWQVVGVGGTGVLSNVATICAGGRSATGYLGHACAAKSDGTVYCWGHNYHGQLGDNSTTDSDVPVQVHGVGGGGFLEDVEALTCGKGHVCAIRTDGTLVCWGDGSEGKLGNGGTLDSEVPVLVSTLQTVARVTAGGMHTCATKTDQSLWCWGDGSYGRLGNGLQSDSYFPTSVFTLDSVVSIDAGEDHTCAIRSDGSLWCWGQGNFGQIGDGGWEDHSVPVQVAAGVTYVAAGVDHTCAYLNTGEIACWGSNQVGQLGIGTRTISPQPLSVSVSSPVRMVSAGGYHACAAGTDGSAWCWGNNNDGRLGDGSLSSIQVVPTRVVGAGGTGVLSNVSLVSVSRYHSAAVLNDKTAWTWGASTAGELGNGSTTPSEYPVQVVGVGGTGTLADVEHISAGEHFTCASLTGGAVYCWGANSYGQLGDGVGWGGSSTPVQVLGDGGVGFLSPVASIAAGTHHSCAALVGGAVYCWGRNQDGQLGDDSQIDADFPVQVVGVGGVGFLADVIEVSVRTNHSCALQSGGTVVCWGNGSEGKHGTNGSGIQTAPVQTTISQAGSITAGDEHTCSLMGGGAVASCWGSNDTGELGNLTTTDSSIPVAVAGLSGLAWIAAGYGFTCAVETGGALWCWGTSQLGQLGVPEYFHQPSPVVVSGF